MTVRDMLEERGTFGLAFCKGRLIAYDGKDGKKIFDTRKNKRELVEKYYNARVDCIWSEIVTEDSTFGNRAEPVTKCYLVHNTLHDERERPNSVPFEYISEHKCYQNDGSRSYSDSTECHKNVSLIMDYLKSLGFENVDFVEELTGKTSEEIKAQ